MSEIRFYINGFRVDMHDREKIGYTKQVNSLSNLASRQANFSKTFKVPATPRNVENFKGLGIVGSNSNLPYIKNEAKLFVGNVCLVYNGFSIFRGKNGPDFEINVYDGNIGFFKNLDNIKFDDIDLSQLNHQKDVAVIKSNWENNNDYYEYLFTDYNGEVFFNENGNYYINTDYLIPSAKVKYLWENIFSQFNYSFTGSIFNTTDFLNLFLTYPKGVTSSEVSEEYASIGYDSENMPYTNEGVFNPLFHPDTYEPDDIEKDNVITQGSLNPTPYSADALYYEIPEDGHYDIEVTGTLSVSFVLPDKVYVGLGVNLENESPSSINVSDLLYVFVDGDDNDVYQIDFSQNKFFSQGDTIMMFYYRTSKLTLVNNAPDGSGLNFELKISKKELTQINQVDFFKGLTPKDFFREIMWRFGLTPFPSKDKQHLDFLTWEERINGDVQDWSDFYIGSEEEDQEEYLYQDYAKQNLFKFKYNDEGEDFNDGSIRIDNENIKESKDVIVSKTYSHNAFIQRLLLLIPSNPNPTGVFLPKFELWDKEVKQEDDETIIEYKSKNARFSFVEKDSISVNHKIGSKSLSNYSQVSNIKTVKNTDYSFQKKVNDYYAPVRDLFNQTLVIKTKFNLDILKFDSFDMKPRIYVKQLGGEFLLNKMSKNDLTQKETEVELIKINR